MQKARVGNTYLATTLSASELPAFPVSEIQVTTDYSLVQLGARYISHARERFCVRIEFYKTETTRRPEWEKKRVQVRENLLCAGNEEWHTECDGQVP